MKPPWDWFLRRAEQLAANGDASADLLRFYGSLLATQGDVASRLVSRGAPSLTGDLVADLPGIRRTLGLLVESIAGIAPEPLAVEARDVLNGGDARLTGTLLEYWQVPTDLQFLGKASLQPYARVLADTGIPVRGRPATTHSNRCPFCGGAPQLSILREAGPTGEDGGRTLMCATCLTAWPYRRLACAACGEEDEHRLGYFRSDTYDHIRVEACDTCRRYIKGIDLTRLGRAEPLVDEVAAAALDMWAHEQGFTKIELNLVGL